MFLGPISWLDCVVFVLLVVPWLLVRVGIVNTIKYLIFLCTSIREYAILSEGKSQYTKVH